EGGGNFCQLRASHDGRSDPIIPLIAWISSQKNCCGYGNILLEETEFCVAVGTSVGKKKISISSVLWRARSSASQ
ncbi:hypothetical protein B296_00049689, partial [Ensete ventricosum]